MLNTLPALSFTSLLLSSFSLASQADSHLHSQYGMSLSDETVTMASGAVTHPMAAQGNQIMGAEEKAIVEVTDGVYHLAGWGLANSTAIEGPEGWIIIDTGDNIPAAREQRAYLEAKVGKIEVAAVLYTHSHYVWGGSVWQDKNTVFYGHEDLVSTLQGDTGISVLSGNFMTRAVAQYGILHPEQGPDAFPNKMGFNAAKLSAPKAFIPPSVTFKDNIIETHNIAGLTVEVLPSKTDVTESVAFYFPEKKLLSGNALGVTLFNLYTLRGDWYRNPMEYVKAIDLVLTRDIEYQTDVHGKAKVGRDNVIASLQEARDQMQLTHDQTFRAIALGMDAQEAAEWVYMPENLRRGREIYGQLESHVKRVYGARIGWMGWDVYDINPLKKSDFSENILQAMGGFDAVLKSAKAANARQTLKDWQWSLYLTSQLLQAQPENQDVKLVRAEASRALGQRTTSANARGWYISEARLREENMQFAGHTIQKYAQLSQMIGTPNAEKLAKSSLHDNVQYLRYLVDSRLAEGKQAQFNAQFKEDDVTYAIALRNGVIAVTDQPNDGPTIAITKTQWDSIILGESTFAELNKSLVAIDLAIGR
jgi:alkyl sulfatase BDS1-like metallo-beta-lactamase superfamily hydrolase